MLYKGISLHLMPKYIRKDGRGCEMSDLKELMQIDWWYVIIAIMLLLFCMKLIWSLLDWLLFEKLGIKTKKMRQREQETKQLKETTELAKKTAENLDKLERRCTKDEDDFKKSLNDYMEESRKDRKALHDEMTNYSDNRIKDRMQSLAIQKELQDSQNKISEKVENMCKKLNDMGEKENRRVQSEIKERIAQSYREYNRAKRISPMELEALEDLIKTYEMHGGENSFVHSVVQKEMYTWEVGE